MNPEPGAVIAETRIVTAEAQSLAAIALTRRCGQPAGSGPCENATVTQWFEGHGWRCRHHMPPGEHWPHSRRGVADTSTDKPPAEPEIPPEPLPNNGRLDDFEDAQALIRWAAREAAFGRITESHSRAVVNAAKAFIIAMKQGEESERGKKIYAGLVKAGFIKEDK